MKTFLAALSFALVSCAEAPSGDGQPAPVVQSAPAGCSLYNQGWHHFCGASVISWTSAYYCGVSGNVATWYYEHAADASDPVPRSETRQTELGMSNGQCP